MDETKYKDYYDKMQHGKRYTRTEIAEAVGYDNNIEQALGIFEGLGLLLYEDDNGGLFRFFHAGGR